MGPRHRCRGNVRLQAALETRNAASMGPRHRCRGNARKTSHLASYDMSLQWGRGIDAAEMSAEPAAATGMWTRFNGAAASMPRKFEAPRCQECGNVASMGPRHRCRGNADALRDSREAGPASMGPRHRCRGNLLVRHAPAVVGTCFNGAAASMPRKCRALKAMEYARFASMGPRHRCRGNQAVVHRSTEPLGSASMGPRHRCRGNQGTAVLNLAQGTASMGPRHRCRGNRAETTRERTTSWGFNGAAASMPRKFTEVRSDSSIGLSFNGAAASMPRKSLRQDRLRLLAQRFNGAAASMPRKCIAFSSERPFDLAASMGPRHRCRGNDGGGHGGHLRDALQWGRGIDAAEIAGRAWATQGGFRFNGAAASMPRKWCLGYRPLDSQARFNGAAASMPRKCRPSRQSVSPRLRFNGAAASMPRKSRSWMCLPRPWRTCFNGAAASMPRK